MHKNTKWLLVGVGLLISVLAIGAVACGDDDEDDAPAATEAPADDDDDDMVLGVVANLTEMAGHGAAGAAAGEPCWELPLWDGYRQQIKSDTADIKNVGGRPAGAITAGWFLKEFVEKQPWAHLDIAGTAYLEHDRPEIAKGPTGVGVRLFTEFVLRRAAG